MAKVIEGLYYSESHEFVRVEGNFGFIGITDYAQNALGNVVYVDMPDVDDEVSAGEEFGAVESVKAASDLISPVSGTVVEVNEALENFRTGSILVCKQTSKALLPLVRKAAGLVLEDSDPEGQGVIAGLSLDIPVIIGATGATRILSSGAVVTLNAADGTVSCN